MSSATRGTCLWGFSLWLDDRSDVNVGRVAGQGQKQLRECSTAKIEILKFSKTCSKFKMSFKF